MSVLIFLWECHILMPVYAHEQEKEASLLRSLEAANLAALQATRQAHLPALPHPLALRSLLNGVMSGASAVCEGVRARAPRQSSSSEVRPHSAC
jgi:hypothetical protein